MSRHDDELLDDQHDDWIDSTLIYLRDTLKKLTARVDALETGARSSAKPTGQPAVRPAVPPPSATAAGEAVLAKAVGGFADGDALLAYADRQVSDPTTVGIISGHIAAGDLQSAKEAVLEHVQRGHVAKAAEVMQQATNALDDDLAGYDARAAVSEITARFGVMERTISALEGRLTQLERRPQNVPVPVVPQQQTVAKAAGSKRPKTQEETAESLLAQIDAYIDSPSIVGQLSSMVAAGKFAEVRRVLSGAKQAHDTQRLIHERKGFNQN